MRLRGNRGLLTDKEGLRLPAYMPRKNPEMCNLKSELSPPSFFRKTPAFHSFLEYKLHKHAFHHEPDPELEAACYQTRSGISQGSRSPLKDPQGLHPNEWKSSNTDNSYLNFHVKFHLFNLLLILKCRHLPGCFGRVYNTNETFLHA